MTGTCTVPGCTQAVFAAGLCGGHYKRRRRGQPLPTSAEPQVGDPDGYGRYGILDRDDGGVTCHECGRRLAALGWHVCGHDMTADEYRESHGLSRGQPLTSLGTAAALSAASSARTGTARTLSRARIVERRVMCGGTT